VSLEAVLATGVLSPSESAQRLQTLTQLAYQEKTYAAVVGYAERYYARGGTDRTPRVLMAQAYYLESDYANAARTVRALLQADAKTAAAPLEDLLLTLASSEFKSGDAAGYRDALMRLVGTYPKRQYWIDLLAAQQRAPGFADRLRLDLDRLRLAADAFDTPGRYVESAERALAAGFPGDARAFLDHGLHGGALDGGPTAERVRRLADLAARQAADDTNRWSAQAVDAAAAANGAAWDALGEAYASAGDTGAAIAAFEKSLREGGLPHPEDATLHLGIACLRAGQVDRAKQLLSSVAGRDGTADLARLWLILNHLDTRSASSKDSRS
jgi:tetratricopeptide (TPR) repeat protein